EGDGTVLDHTIILWGTEVGNPTIHDNMDQAFLLAGGANGKLQMGRVAKFHINEPADSVDPPKFESMTAHNGILVAIQQAFGVQSDTFGDPDYVGALPGLLSG